MAAPTTGTAAPRVLGGLQHQLREALPELVVDWEPTAVSDPQLVVLNEELAEQLDLDAAGLASEGGLAVLAGSAVPDGAMPVAMAYAGHQFGSYSPLLGDGRAALLGEVATDDGLVDLHLKGSGRTRFARGGDGKATVDAMLREYLIAEAMHALGVPTGRALAVVTTGESILRTGPLPGAVLTRAASSHLRVGTFELAARLEDPSVLERLVHVAIERHHPAAADADNPYLALLDSVVEAQAALVARWMLLGFIHGVMNTDNTTISGETIDYGPCAFMDRFDPATVYSSIDHGGRYAYGNQPAIMQWNLARLAETLLRLVDPDSDAAIAAASEVLEEFPARYSRRWAEGMASKLGLVEVGDGDESLLEELPSVLATAEVDYTSFFRGLSAQLVGSVDPSDADAGLRDWVDRWRARVGAQDRELPATAAAMDAVNPVYVPRNHLVDAALSAAASGDLEPFSLLLDHVTDPFSERPGSEAFAEPAPAGFDESFQTFCGT